jgi:nickel-dependent lactate racemase
MTGETIALAYGNTTLPVRVPAANLEGILQPRPAAQGGDEAALVRQALARPIGSPPLRALARPGQKVAIVTSDLTRPCPSERLLPPVLAELAAAGVPDDDIFVVMALGLHRPMAATEMARAVGQEMHRRLRVINHDPRETVHLGTTPAGTPVQIFRPVVEADLRICLGNLELHYFAGYSGGAKAIVPGCASRATLNANHAMMVERAAAAGRLDGNPVRADLEAATAMLGVDSILNVVVDATGGWHRIVGAVAGDVTAAHRAGCQMVARRGIVPVARAADVVVVSAGGHPKDLNLYQAQKALDNAAHAVRDGGVIVLVASCPEGLGNPTFEAWLTDVDSPGELLARIRREFVLGGHKAAAVAAVLQRAQVYLVSELPADLTRRCGMVPFPSPGEALTAALSEVGTDGRVLVLPQGGSVLPQVQE